MLPSDEPGYQFWYPSTTDWQRLVRTIAALALLFVCVWTGTVTLLWAAQSRLLFRTATSRAYTAPIDPAIFQEGTFPSDEGLRLRSVRLTHDSGSGRYWILFCPPAGASTHLARIQRQLKQLWSLGYNVFAFDYRGFGGNAGAPTEEGLYTDAMAAYADLTRTYGVDTTHVILAGRSLGSAVAIELATRVEAGGLLLFSPIDSVPRTAARLYPWAPVSRLVYYRFDNVLKAQHLDLPMILLYGVNDRFMPRTNAEALFQEFRGRKLMIDTAGGHHFSGFMDVSQLRDALVTFWPPEATPALR